MSTLKKLIFLFLSVSIFVTCKKTEEEVIYLKRARSSFATEVYDIFQRRNVRSETALIDSNFYFINLSDTGAYVSYHWDFGDGTTSTEINPVHHYTKRGHYKVTMETRVKDMISNLSETRLNVIVGETALDEGEERNIQAFDIVQTANGEFILLVRVGSSITYDDQYVYFLYILDERRRVTAKKALPTNRWYTKMIICSDGNLLLASSVSQSATVNRLTKVNTDAEELWSKTYDNASQILQIKQVKDGGYILSCNRNMMDEYENPIPRSYLIKLDESGTQQWDKYFIKEDALYNTGALYEEEDGYVFAGADVDFNNVDCWSCSTLSLIKLDQTGQITWRHHASWGINNAGGETEVSKMGNQYIVSSWSNKALYYFSGESGFLDRKLMPFNAHSFAITKQNNLVSINSDYPSGNSEALIAGISEQGSTLWLGRIDGRQLLADGYSCCSTANSIKVIPLNSIDGGSLMLAWKINHTNAFNYYTISIIKEFAENGEEM